MDCRLFTILDNHCIGTHPDDISEMFHHRVPVRGVWLQQLVSLREDFLFSFFLIPMLFRRHCHHYELRLVFDTKASIVEMSKAPTSAVKTHGIGRQ
jgi:hypothetical protein